MPPQDRTGYPTGRDNLHIGTELPHLEQNRPQVHGATDGRCPSNQRTRSWVVPLLPRSRQ